MTANIVTARLVDINDHQESTERHRQLLLVLLIIIIILLLLLLLFRRGNYIHSGCILRKLHRQGINQERIIWRNTVPHQIVCLCSCLELNIHSGMLAN